MAAKNRKERGSVSAREEPKRQAHAPKHEHPKRDVAVLTEEELEEFTEPRGRTTLYEEFRFLGAYNAT